MIEPGIRRVRGMAVCEVCWKRLATRKAKYAVRYLEELAAGVASEERMVETLMEQKVCEGCLANLQKASNISQLTFERL
jgi:hypothetical protein